MGISRQEFIEFRKSKNLTLKVIAGRAKIGPETLRTWEKGRSELKYDQRRRLELALGKF